MLISHITVEALDAEHPASLSPAVVAYLRDKLGFTGVIMTDDLGMAAVGGSGYGATAVAALQAGCDLLCCPGMDSALPTIEAALERDELSWQRIDQSVLRILRWKVELGLMGAE